MVFCCPLISKREGGIYRGSGLLECDDLCLQKPIYCTRVYLVKYVFSGDIAMRTHTILANESVSMTDLRNNLKDYFTDHAIAVLSNNKPAGYVIGASAYEAMVNLLMQAQQTETFDASFVPASERLKAITRKGMEMIEDASSKELDKLGQYSE